MLKLKELINESTWDRKFGEPLPTLSDVMEKKESCCDSCKEGEISCSVTESVKDVVKGKKLLQKIMNTEGRLREQMYKLSDRLNSDPLNQKLSEKLTNSYKKHITNFMRDTVKIVKDMK